MVTNSSINKPSNDSNKELVHNMIDAVWAYLIIEECIRNDVTNFVIGPGSRSTPLTLAVARHPKAQAHVHFDERGCGFFALGIAKASRKPVALITTSGTAVANVKPAMIEAFQSKTPLIMFSADRPFELQDVAANQSIKQQHIFSSFTCYETNLEVPTKQVSASFLLRTIDYAIFQAKYYTQPVHINCPYREPFTLTLDEKHISGSDYLSEVNEWQHNETPFSGYHFNGPHLNNDVLDQCFNSFINKRNVLLIIGELRTESERQAILNFLKVSKIPFVADITSGLRAINLDSNLSANETILENCDVILHIGGRIVSSQYDKYVTENGIPLLRFSSYVHRQDPGNNLSSFFTISIKQFCKYFIKKSFNTAMINEINDRDSLQSIQNIAIDLVEKQFVEYIMTVVTPDQFLFLGNSSPIRWFDKFMPKIKLYSQVVFSNRGASGIDGLVATAAGCCTSLNQSGVLVLGDLSLLYDVNSLSLLKNLKTNLHIVVINNYGGGIFDQLPVSSQGDIYDRYFKAEHSYSFEHTAKQFGLDYYRIEIGQNFHLINDFILNSSSSSLIEVQI